MKITSFLLVGSTAVFGVSASPSTRQTRSTSSIIECKNWDQHCRIGTIYDESAKSERCKDRTDSTMACIDECCKPLVAPKESSFVKCKQWTGQCRPGSTYDTKAKNDRCKDRTNSDYACVDECCKPFDAPSRRERKSSSIIECVDWDAQCPIGTTYNTPAMYDRCKARDSSTMACSKICCTTVIPPTPTPTPTPSSFIQCVDWQGTCESGTEYITSAMYARCKPRDSSSESCQKICCTPLILK
eukprot:CFRG8380T1